MASKIEQITNKYKFTLDFSDSLNSPNMIDEMFHGYFKVQIREYCFDKRITKINERINDEKSTINKDLLKSCSKKVNEIKNYIDTTLKEIKDEHDLTQRLLFHLKMSYDNNDDIPDVYKVYKDLVNTILKERSEKYIKYEKIFFLMNDNIFEINKQLHIDN